MQRNTFVQHYGGEALDAALLLIAQVCSFWLADAYVMLGRGEDARALFGRRLALRNDLGLLAEEYDPVSKRLVGNFPQGFSHIGLINTACNLIDAQGPARQRSERVAPTADEAARTG